eukprot:5787773-Amphidinium_carterae.1
MGFVLELQGAERCLHSELHGRVKPILRGKNLLVWERPLQRVGYEDSHLLDELKTGFGMIGQGAKSG